MPADAAVMPQQAPPLQLCLRADPLAVRHTLARVMADPLLARLDPDLRDRAEILLAEVLNNIVEHAYAGQPGPIRLCIGPNPTGLLILAEDEGRPMPAARLPPGDLPPLTGDLPEGGFGWCLIRSLATSLTYRRGPNGNCLTLILPINDSADSAGLARIQKN